MSRLFAYLARLIVILIGFFCASLGASAFLHLLVLGGMSWTGEEIAFVAGGFLFSVPFVALFVGYFAFLPAMIVILLAEFLQRSDWLFFALAGGAAGLAVAYFDRFQLRGDAAPQEATIAMALGATGIVGGICYWLVAGRSSGASLYGSGASRRGMDSGDAS